MWAGYLYMLTDLLLVLRTNCFLSSSVVRASDSSSVSSVNSQEARFCWCEMKSRLRREEDKRNLLIHSYILPAQINWQVGNYFSLLLRSYRMNFRRGGDRMCECVCPEVAGLGTRAPHGTFSDSRGTSVDWALQEAGHQRLQEALTSLCCADLRRPLLNNDDG